LQSAWDGLQIVFSWPYIVYPIVGTLLAMAFALLPGLSGAALMALAIPLTIQWDPIAVMLLFGAFLGGATFMGSVTADLFNIPGRPSNAASLIDGYPLARAGQARTALGCSAAASALGSTFGVVILLLAIPIVRQLLLAFGPAELLLMIVWGLTAIAALSRDALLKGLIAAGLGLTLSFVGLDPQGAAPRFTFTSSFLESGISLVPAFLGLYALAELFALMRNRRPTISRQGHGLGGSVRAGVATVFRHPWLFLRSSAIGTVIGMIPGVGGTVASFVAYGHAVQSSRDDPKFGQGDIRGLLAPEAANDAKDGGALIPTLAFGIPGGTGTAMLLAVLTLHGLEPGREMLGSQLTYVFVLIWSLFLSNWLTSVLGLATISPLARLTTIRSGLLIPALLIIATVGAYLYRGEMLDVATAYACGALGYAMKVGGWPRIPMMIGLVLGALFERNLLLVMRLTELDRLNIFERPASLVLILMIAVVLAYPLVRNFSRRIATEDS